MIETIKHGSENKQLLEHKRNMDGNMNQKSTKNNTELYADGSETGKGHQNECNNIKNAKEKIAIYT